MLDCLIVINLFNFEVVLLFFMMYLSTFLYFEARKMKNWDLY